MTSSPYPAHFHIPSLDGLRAIAILIVFVSHAGLKIIPGGFGVTVFFFISGYLITTLLRREYELSGAIHLKNFFMRRMLRIWPAFYLVLLAGAALTLLHVLDGNLKLSAFLSQCLHVGNYYSIGHGVDGLTGGSGVYWSLAVEEHFYLVLPLLYLLMLKIHMPAKRQMQVFLWLCLLALVWRCILVYGFTVTEDRTYYASDTRFDSLLFGCAMAVYGNPALDKPNITERMLKFVLLPLGLGLIVFSWLYRNGEFRETLRYTLQGIGLFPVFMAAIRFPGWRMFRWLNWRWIKFAGVLSYSMYLVHLTVIKAVVQYWPQAPALLQGIAALGWTLVLAYLIYRFVEVPFGRLRKKFKIA